MQCSHLELFLLHLSQQINPVLKLQQIEWNKIQRSRLKELVDLLLIHSTPDMQIFTALDVEPRSGVGTSQRGDSGECQNISPFI